MSRYPGSPPIAIAVCGDPVVGKALGLLLQGYRCDARFLPEQSLSELGSLECIRLLLLTPHLSAKRRDLLLASLRSVMGAVKMPILELTTNYYERIREVRVWGGQECAVPWPCSIEELRRRIEEVALPPCPEVN